MQDDIELLEFFDSEPIERSVEEGYSCYAITDSRAVTLRFSFHRFERSVQTIVSFGGDVLTSVSHEAADGIVLREGKLRCEFSTADSETVLTLEIVPQISMVWSGLRTR